MTQNTAQTLGVTTRFAPSPTGYLHVGNLRTALMNWMVARKAGGTFLLRIDDTDAERSKQEYVDALKQDLEWLGLTWDREERQSARLGRYAEVAEELKASGRLYEVFETPEELDLRRKKQLAMGRPPVYDRAGLKLDAAAKEQMRAEGRVGYWRFLLENRRVEWRDGILGDLSIDAGSLSDPVLIKASGQVLYTFASPVDDADMGVTDIVRGADHVTNTATQIEIIEAMGHAVPRFAHHSLLTGAAGEELSKRLGALSLRDLRAAGVAPEALLSMMARLGSSKPIELMMSAGELAESFDLSDFGAAPTRFDPEELTPLTRHALQQRPYAAVADQIAALGVPKAEAEAFWQVVSHNIDTLDELGFWADLCLKGAQPVIDPEDAAFVAQALALLPEGPFGAETWRAWTAEVKAQTGRKGRGLFMPLRKALTGLEHGPEMSELMPLLHHIKARG